MLFLYLATAGYNLIPSVQKFALCLWPICHCFVSALYLEQFWLIFFKLCIRVDILDVVWDCIWVIFHERSAELLPLIGVGILFQSSILSINFCVRVNTGEEWFGIVDGCISSNKRSYCPWLVVKIHFCALSWALFDQFSSNLAWELILGRSVMGLHIL